MSKRLACKRRRWEEEDPWTAIADSSSSDEDLDDPGNWRTSRKQAPSSPRPGSPARRYPRRDISAKSYSEAEIHDVDEDAYVYCDDCKLDYREGCPDHPLQIVEDVEVPVNAPDRALRTLPLQLAVLPSKIPGAGQGVWSKMAIPRGTRFGPYAGDIKPAKKYTETGYCWEIRRGGKHAFSVDAADSSNSNWMRYVNCARHLLEENLHPFQYKGNLYYRTVVDVPANTELLVWYGDTYAKLLGVDPKASKEPVKDTRPFTGMFPCSSCDLAFVSPLLLNQHKRSGRCWAEQQRRRVAPTDADDPDDPDDPGEPQPKAATTATQGSTGGATRPSSPGQQATADATDADAPRQTETAVGTEGARVGTPVAAAQPKGGFAVKSVQAQAPRPGSAVKSVQAGRSSLHPPGTALKTIQPGRSHVHPPGTALKTVQPARPTILAEKCKLCEASFPTKEKLRIHLFTHITKTPQQVISTGVRRGRPPARPPSWPPEEPAPAPVTTTSTRAPGRPGRPPGQPGRPLGQPVQGAPTAIKSSSTPGRPPGHPAVTSTYTPGRPGRPPGPRNSSEADEHKYTCATCKARFKQKEQLEMHMRIHTEEKPYTCDTCGAKFVKSGHLSNHQRMHVSKKPHVCDKCGAAFTERGALQVHLRIHTEEKPQPQERVHSEEKPQPQPHVAPAPMHSEKPHVCGSCGDTFKLVHHLRLHQKIHTRDKPISMSSNIIIQEPKEDILVKCDECDTPFNQTEILMHRHMHSAYVKLTRLKFFVH